MDQVTIVNTDTIRAAIERTNEMVVERACSSATVKWKRTRNIMAENVECPLSQARIVSMAPELSLATIGDTIPVVELPEGAELPTLTQMAFILTQIGNMVCHWYPPPHSIQGNHEYTRDIPNIYTRVMEAMNYCLGDLMRRRQE